MAMDLSDTLAPAISIRTQEVSPLGQVSLQNGKNPVIVHQIPKLFIGEAPSIMGCVSVVPSECIRFRPSLWIGVKWNEMRAWGPFCTKRY